MNRTKPLSLWARLIPRLPAVVIAAALADDLAFALQPSYHFVSAQSHLKE